MTARSASNTRGAMRVLDILSLRSLLPHLHVDSHDHHVFFLHQNNSSTDHIVSQPSRESTSPSLPTASHNPLSSRSTGILSLLRSSLAEPYPPHASSKKPLNFNLDVVEGTPTKDQFDVINRYSGGSVQVGGDAMKWPVVVDWDNGKVAVESSEGAKEILAHLVKVRDGN